MPGSYPRLRQGAGCSLGALWLSFAPGAARQRDSGEGAGGLHPCQRELSPGHRLAGPYLRRRWWGQVSWLLLLPPPQALFYLAPVCGPDVPRGCPEAFPLPAQHRAGLRSLPSVRARLCVPTRLGGGVQRWPWAFPIPPHGTGTTSSRRLAQSRGPGPLPAWHCRHASLFTQCLRLAPAQGWGGAAELGPELHWGHRSGCQPGLDGGLLRVCLCVHVSVCVSVCVHAAGLCVGMHMCACATR